MDGASSGPPLCSPSSAGAWGSMAHPSFCTPSTQSADGRWPVSAAVTVHFLVGAVAVTNLPALHRRFGVAWVTKVSALALAIGVCGWALATAPWQLFAATLLSGFGWSGMSAAAINAIVSPWFIRSRPAALAMAYNGGSIGGVIFSPLWVAAIQVMGFPIAAATLGAVMVLTIWILADTLFSKSPQQMGLAPDGDALGVIACASARATGSAAAGAAAVAQCQVPHAGCRHGDRFVRANRPDRPPVLSAGAGAWRAYAGLAMGAATAAAVVGRTLVGWLMPSGADRRLVACMQLCRADRGLAGLLAGRRHAICRCCSPASSCSASASATPPRCRRSLPRRSSSRTTYCAWWH